MAKHNPLTGYEPKLLDDFHYSETSAAIFQDESGDIDTEPKHSCDAHLDDEIVGKALSWPLFIQERQEPADRRQAYHSYEESLLPAQSFFAHTNTGRPVYEPCSSQKRKSGRDLENERIRILLERQKKQILGEVKTEIQKHEFQADSDRRSIQELTGIIDSQRREIDHTIASDEQSRRDQSLLQEQRSEQNRDLREAHIKSLHEMEELKRVQASRFDTISRRRRLIEDQDTINELTGKIQELQNEINCMNGSRDFQDAVDNPTFPVNQRFSHLFEILAECWAVLWECRAATIGRQVFGIRRVYRETFFANPPASSSSPCPGGFNHWMSNGTQDTSPHVTSERQIPETALDPRFQSGPSARNSSDPKEGNIFKGLWGRPTKTADFGSPLWQVPYTSNLCLLEDKIQDRGMYLFTIPTEAMQWIKEVELVDSVISNLRVLSEELLVQTLSCLTRELR